MVSSQPHFLLFSRAESQAGTPGVWHFLLESTDGQTVVEASDSESDLRGERLELLAVVRGLEALDQPSRVTLLTASRRISRGFRYGLEAWRNNDWQWERDGRWVPIKNADLWRRVDRALRFHHVKCRTWRLDSAARGDNGPQRATSDLGGRIGSAPVTRHSRADSAPSKLKYPFKRRLTAAFRAFFDSVDTHGAAQLSN